MEFNHLRHILEEDPPKGRLDRAALEIATIDTPDLAAEPVLERLNELAANLGDRLRNFNDGREFVEKAQAYLFEELGFHGSEQDFFDSRNSCLDQVLERRVGLPITLSVLYMEIARRLAMPVFGIGLPRHFVIQFDDGKFSAYIDPYHGGKIVTPEECFALAGVQVADPMLLRPVSKKTIVMRMLQNLRSVYLRRDDWAKAVQILDLLMIGAPEIASWYKQRGLLYMELKRQQAARADLETYLKMEPEAPDAEAIRKQLQSIHAWLGRLN